MQLVVPGIGYVDAHLVAVTLLTLAATLLTPDARLWTRDKRLATVAEPHRPAPALVTVTP